MLLGIETIKTIKQLIDSLPQTGTVIWLASRPTRRAPLLISDTLALDTLSGIIGDRYQGRSGKRQVTLIQSEHLSVIASFLGTKNVTPELLRRNILIQGINLLALKNQQVAIGETVLEITGECHPCSFMEETLGPGGYNAVRGHGGVTARVLRGGIIKLGDTVRRLTTQ